MGDVAEDQAEAWEDRRDVKWSKFYLAWYSSPSHMDFGIDEHAIGPFLLCMANTYGRQSDGSGRCVTVTGDVLTAEILSKRFGVQKKRIIRSLNRIEKAGTIICVDGCYVFPKLKKFQESRAAERMRKRRNSDAQKAPKRRNSDAEKIRRSEDLLSEDLKTNGSGAEPRSNFDQNLELVPTEPPPDVICEIPLSGNRKPHRVTRRDLDEMADAFPAVDLEHEAKRAAAWIKADKKRRGSNAKTFLFNWFSRAQDQSHSRVRAPPQQRRPMNQADLAFAKVRVAELIEIGDAIPPELEGILPEAEVARLRRLAIAERQQLEAGTD